MEANTSAGPRLRHSPPVFTYVDAHDPLDTAYIVALLTRSQSLALSIASAYFRLARSTDKTFHVPRLAELLQRSQNIRWLVFQANNVSPQIESRLLQLLETSPTSPLPLHSLRNLSMEFYPSKMTQLELNWMFQLFRLAPNVTSLSLRTGTSCKRASMQYLEMPDDENILPRLEKMTFVHHYSSVLPFIRPFRSRPSLKHAQLVWDSEAEGSGGWTSPLTRAERLLRRLMSRSTAEDDEILATLGPHVTQLVVNDRSDSRNMPLHDNHTGTPMPTGHRRLSVAPHCANLRVVGIEFELHSGGEGPEFSTILSAIEYFLDARRYPHLRTLVLWYYGSGERRREALCGHIVEALSRQLNLSSRTLRDVRILSRIWFFPVMVTGWKWQSLVQLCHRRRVHLTYGYVLGPGHFF